MNELKVAAEKGKLTGIDGFKNYSDGIELGMSLVRCRPPVLPHSPLFTQLDTDALDDVRRHTRIGTSPPVT